MRDNRDEHGAVSIIVAAAMAIVVALIGIVVAVSQIRATRGHVQAVADIAALSAGPRGCPQAEAIAARNGVRLLSCERLGLDVRVELAAPVFGLGEVTAAARAAPVLSDRAP